MSIVVQILVALHLIGWGTGLGALLTRIKDPAVPSAVTHGLYLALATGLAITGIAGAQQWDLNYTKIGVKLLLALIATALAVVGKGRPTVSRGYLASIAGLILTNVFLAVLWRGEEA